jgi:molybdopterin-guanine dinucleotide biosynthesis protein A
MKFSAVILAGEASRRMGRDKSAIEFQGRTLLARQVALARAGAGRSLHSGSTERGLLGAGLSGFARSRAR